MPFLGPAVILWIALGVAVMAYYFAIVAPRYWRKEPVEETRWEAPRPLRPWIEQPPPAAAYEAYDMENFPTENWEHRASA